MAPPMSVLGIDIATQVFHIVGMDDRGHVVRRKRLARRALLPFLANVPPLRIGMDACGSAPSWARRCREHGHDGRLSAPQFVNADVKSPKHEGRDADALCEAVTRPTRHVVPITRVAPHDLHALHRSQERRSKARPAWVHEIRGRLSEDGLVLPHSLVKCRALLVETLEAEPAQLPALGTAVCWPLYAELLAVEKRLAYDDEQLAAMGQAPPACQRRQTIPGIGPVTAPALIAAIGDATQVKNGRQLAAWLGLVLREHSTGGKPLSSAKMLSISPHHLLSNSHSAS